MKYRIRKVETFDEDLYYPEELWFSILWYEFWCPLLTHYDAPKICASYLDAKDFITQTIKERESEISLKNFNKKETIIPYE